MIPADPFSCHLDLRPLRGRRRGLVKCPFHPDHTPSFSVDLDRQIFFCHGCGVGGGVKRFRELVGGPVEASAARPARPRSPLEEARAQALAEARRQRAKRESYRDLRTIADFLRPRFQAVAEARKVATAMGPTERAWDLLEKAARVEREALAVESGLDELLPLPRPEDLDASLAGGRL